MMSEIINRK